MHFLSISATATVADDIVAMKSIAAYRSGLQIDTEVTKRAAEEGLFEDLNGKCRERVCKMEDLFKCCEFF